MRARLALLQVEFEVQMLWWSFVKRASESDASPNQEGQAKQKIIELKWLGGSPHIDDSEGANRCANVWVPLLAEIRRLFNFFVDVVELVLDLSRERLCLVSLNADFDGATTGKVEVYGNHRSPNWLIAAMFWSIITLVSTKEQPDNEKNGAETHGATSDVYYNGRQYRSQ